MLKRRTLLTTAALAAVPLALPHAALAQGRKDAIVLGMALEPPGLDPTAGAAAAIAEIVQYNIFETLTKINADGSVTPLLAESWEVSPDLKHLHLQAAPAASSSRTASPSTRRRSSSPSTAPAARRAPTRTSAPSPT